MRPAIPPFFFTACENPVSGVSIRLSPDNRRPEAISATLGRIEQIWRKVLPNEKFVYHFFDEEIARAYDKEQSMAAMLRLAMGIAIAISCMGLLGLASFAAEQRGKEISIRKVLGASVGRIVGLLTANFLWPVALAIVIATPLAWYLMHAWLQDFVYRVTVPWWIFGLAGLGAIGIALLTVGYQAVRAAVTNPVEKLRSE
jgi:putative ABC transport system permease protein